MDVDIMLDPSRYGYDVCLHCNGHGASLRDSSEGGKCTMCGGLGLVKRNTEKVA